MIDAIEVWARDYQFTIAAVSAISTALAVVVSLGISIHSTRAMRTKLRASVNLNIIIHETIEIPPRYITCGITNIGTLPLRIPQYYFSWKVPFQRYSFLITVMDAGRHDPLVPVKQYPLTLEPRMSVTLFISSFETFQSELARVKYDLPWHGRLLFPLMGARVTTDDGVLVGARIDKEIRRAIFEIKAVPRSDKKV